MARYQGVETDLNGAIVPGAKIYVYQFDGKTLAALKDDFGNGMPNPVVSDSLGAYSFNVASQGLYYLKHQYSGRYELFEITPVGELIAAVLPSPANAGKFIGLDADGAPTYLSGTGADAGLRTDLAATTGGALVGVNDGASGSLFTSVAGFVAKVVSSAGASVVGFLQSGTGAVTTNVAAAVRQAGILPAEFGLKFDGTDETAKLQAMVNAAHALGLPIHLTGGTIKVSAPIDLRGKYVCILGAGHALTKIQATASMVAVFRADEASDVIVSPYQISDLTIDGNNLAQAGILTRYRHGTEISRVQIVACSEAGLRERDSWNNVRSIVISYGSPIAFDLQGANNSCVFTKCTAANSDDTHLKISAANITSGLVFVGCDIEYGTGKGVVVAAGCSVDFDTCYIGEGIEGTVFENSGNITVRGGLLNWGATATSYLVRPLAGRFFAQGAEVGAQPSGAIGNLFGLTNAEVDGGTYGVAGFDKCIFGVGTTAQPINGDVLDWVQGRCFVPRFGQDWTPASLDGTVTSSTSGSSKTMTVTAPGASNANLMRAALATGWQQGKPVYIAVVYQASKSVNIRVAETAFGAAYSAGTLPAASRKTTMVFLAPTPVAGTVYQYLELALISAAASDTLTIHKISFGDAGFLGRTGVTENLGIIA